MRLLTLEGPPDWHPAPPESRRNAPKPRAIATQRGADIGKLALQFSVANPDIPVNIVGSASPGRMLKNIREIEEPLDEELLREVLEILEPVHNVTWLAGRPKITDGIVAPGSARRKFYPMKTIRLTFPEPRPHRQHAGHARRGSCIAAWRPLGPGPPQGRRVDPVSHWRDRQHSARS